jgi:hypothetical protein
VRKKVYVLPQQVPLLLLDPRTEATSFKVTALRFTIQVTLKFTALAYLLTYYLTREPTRVGIELVYPQRHRFTAQVCLCACGLVSLCPIFFFYFFIFFFNFKLHFFQFLVVFNFKLHFIFFRIF